MNGFPGRRIVEQLREQFKPGVTVELTSPMEDPYHPLPAGLCGECCGVDDAGQIMMIWSDGSTLSLISGEDRFHIVEETLRESSLLDES